MATTDSETRATSLADQAMQMMERGQVEDGSRIMREAVSLAPDNPFVRKAFNEIQREDPKPPLLQLSRKYATQPNESVAKELLQLFQAPLPRLSAEAANECTKNLFDTGTSKGALGDQVVSAFLRQSSDARRYVAAQLAEATSDLIFELAWNTGDSITHELVSVLIDTSVWPSEDVRVRCEQDVFILFIAKLMEAGQDHMERALKELARLLAADAERLHSLVDDEGLGSILSCLDVRSPTELRAQATFILARYLAASKDEGEQLLSNFITSRVAEQTNDNLIVAFSAAAAVFPIVPSTASRLFLTEGFAQSLVSLLNKKSKNIRIRLTALEMLNAACMDRTCRETIDRYCSGWVEAQMKLGEDPIAATAAVVLAKLRGLDGDQAIPQDSQVREPGAGIEQLVDKFKDLMKASDSEGRPRAIEGLAFASLQPSVKNELASDHLFLRNLIETLRTASPTDDSAIVFGTLNILSNLTRYPPNLSEEQKRMLQLKAYANTSKAKLELDPADRDEAVTARCKILLHANVVPVLVAIDAKLSVSSALLALKILLSLSKEQKHRGILAQQGAVKLLLQRYSAAKPSDKEMRRTAAHTLARISISVNPTLLFRSSGSPSITSAVPPLVALLAVEDDSHSDASATSEGRDLLPCFESLLALTNLASTEDETSRTLIIRQAWQRIEDLLLSHNHLIQRAAVELICNLVVSPEGLAKFIVIDVEDGSKDKEAREADKQVERARARNRLHILLALADAEDDATRRAAAGALAMLTEGADEDEADDEEEGFNPGRSIVHELLQHDRAIPIVLGLCQDDSPAENEGIRHRGIVCLRNVVLCCLSPTTVGDDGAEQPDRRKVMELLKAHNAVDVLRAVLANTKNRQAQQGAVEVLKKLVGR